MNQEWMSEEGLKVIDKQWTAFEHLKWVADGIDNLPDLIKRYEELASHWKHLADFGDKIFLSHPIDGGHFCLVTEDEAIAREFRFPEIQVMVRNDSSNEQWWELDEEASDLWCKELGIDHHCCIEDEDEDDEDDEDDEES